MGELLLLFLLLLIMMTCHKIRCYVLAILILLILHPSYESINIIKLNNSVTVWWLNKNVFSLMSLCIIIIIYIFYFSLDMGSILIFRPIPSSINHPHHCDYHRCLHRQDCHNGGLLLFKSWMSFNSLFSSDIHLSNACIPIVKGSLL